MADGGHEFLAEVAAFGDGPFVVGLDDDGGGEADDGGVLGQESDDVRASFDLGVDALEQVVDQISARVLDWESGERRSPRQRRPAWRRRRGLAVSLRAHLVELGADVRGIGLGTFVRVTPAIPSTKLHCLAGEHRCPTDQAGIADDGPPSRSRQPADTAQRSRYELPRTHPPRSAACGPAPLPTGCTAFTTAATSPPTPAPLSWTALPARSIPIGSCLKRNANAGPSAPVKPTLQPWPPSRSEPGAADARRASHFLSGDGPHP